MRLKNKLLFILFFFILVFIFSGNNSFATYETGTDYIIYNNEYIFDIPEDMLGYKNIVFCWAIESSLQFHFQCLTNNDVFLYDNGSGFWCSSGESENFYYCYGTSLTYTVLDNGLKYVDSDIYYSKGSNSKVSGTPVSMVSTTYYVSNLEDGSSYSSNVNAVFQAPVAEDNQYSLQPILEKTKVGEMVTKEVSQVLLVVMKKVAVVIVGLVGLLTGWLLLLKILHRS